MMANVRCKEITSLADGPSTLGGNNDEMLAGLLKDWATSSGTFIMPGQSEAKTGRARKELMVYGDWAGRSFRRARTGGLFRASDSPVKIRRP